MRDPLSSDSPTDEGPSRTGGEHTDPPASTGHLRRRVRYRPMHSADLAFVVEQHRYHFPDGFFARLGPRFLGEYYRAFLTGAHARTTLAEVDGEPAGYLVGVTDPSAHRDHVVRRHGRSLVLRAAAAMLTHPSLAVCFVRTRLGLYTRKLLRRRSAGTPGAAPSASACPTAVLTHVAIAPEAQSRGIGSELIRRFDDEVAAAGCERLTLVTASGDDGAGPYYRRRGWTALGERCTPDGLWLTTYERPVTRIDDQQAPRSEDTA
jgi:ribosomal protein S18 acetylase RimI-like enzyme